MYYVHAFHISIINDSGTDSQKNKNSHMVLAGKKNIIVLWKAMICVWKWFPT
jgi:hypothetical protein